MEKLRYFFNQVSIKVANKLYEGVVRLENLGARAAGGLIHKRECPVTGSYDEGPETEEIEYLAGGSVGDIPMPPDRIKRRGLSTCSDCGVAGFRFFRPKLEDGKIRMAEDIYRQ